MSDSPNEQLAATILDEYKLANKKQLENLIIQYVTQTYILRSRGQYPSLAVDSKHTHHFFKKRYVVEVHDENFEISLRSGEARTQKDAYLNLLCQAAERCREEYLRFTKPQDTEPGCFGVVMLHSEDVNHAMDAEIPRQWFPQGVDASVEYRTLYLVIVGTYDSALSQLRLTSTKIA